MSFRPPDSTISLFSWAGRTICGWEFSRLPITEVPERPVPPMKIGPCLFIRASASIPQQLVDRGLGAGAFVYGLHDHRAIGGGQRGIVGVGPAAGDDDGIWRHLAGEGLARLTLDDRGGGG